MSITHVNTTNFQQEVLQSDKPVLIDFWANWCGPCRMIAPIVEEIAQEREDIKVVKIDVDEARELAIQFQIASIPTLVAMEGGKITGQSIGVKPKDKILEMF